MKKALITGITGQDGSYLSEYLLDKGYDVHGVVLRTELEDPSHKLVNIQPLAEKIRLHPGNIESQARISEIVNEVKPDECYHLAGQSFVHESFDDSTPTFNININGTLNVLSALHRTAPHCKFYFAGSSEMFGKAEESPQTEDTKFNPRSAYGISKMAGVHITKCYKEEYGMFACSGILFNHESPRRGFEFVTRKISSTIAAIKNGKQNTLVLGNLDSKRDWGFAGDYVKAMWLMLQQNEPDSYVIATGKPHSIREFIDLAFKYADLKFEIIDLHELPREEADNKVKELQTQNDRIFVVQHPKFYKPPETTLLTGDSSKAKAKLGWEPTMSFEELVKVMVENDLNTV